MLCTKSSISREERQVIFWLRGLGGPGGHITDAPESRRRDSGTYNRPMMRIEFDLFTDALSTPVHP